VSSRRECVGSIVGSGLICLVLVVALLVFLNGCASTKCEGNWKAGEPHDWQPNMETAQIEVIPWATGDDGPVVAWVTEWRCCDCSLVHRMAFVPMQDGLVIYIWRLDRETRKERMRRGMFRDMYPNPMAAESGPLEQQGD
jgi:hypothetical protein